VNRADGQADLSKSMPQGLKPIIFNILNVRDKSLTYRPCQFKATRNQGAAVGGYDLVGRGFYT
jgi:hypothetical protein